MTELVWQRKIGEILLERNVVTEKQLEEALKIQEMILKPIGRILIDMEVTTEEQIAEALAEQRGFTRVSVKEYKINKQAVKLFPLPMARLHKALPIDFEDGKIVLAMADPLDVYAIDDVRMITSKDVKPVVCTETEIHTVIDEYLAGVVHPTEEDIKRAFEERLGKTKTSAKDAIPVFVDSAIELAAEKGVSEVYFEPGEQVSHLRFRLNGELQDIVTLRREDHAAVVGHLRKVFGMGKKTQDFAKTAQEVEIRDAKLDLEAILLPSIFGEDVCVKILHAGKELKELEELGLESNALTNLKTAFSSRSGLILGVKISNDDQSSDGTSSLFYAILQILASSQKRIIAVEDRARKQVKGVVHIETSPETGDHFVVNSVLPTVLNSDPEVLMVGSIKDKDSADLVVKAALNGVLVLAAVSGENVVDGLVKLINIGANPLLVAESLKCVVAQKTVKKLCSYCRKSYQPKAETLEMLSEKAGFKIALEEGKSFFTADGCEHCNNSGFFGTIGIFETILASDGIRTALIGGKSAEEIQKIAEKEGLVNLTLDTYYKALQGDISFEEFVKQIS
jgi:type IV pilus assembly protein PilB